MMPSDTEMLDWLQAQNDRHEYTGTCLFRWSTTGRGWRLHETLDMNAQATVRGAISAAIITEKRRRESAK